MSDNDNENKVWHYVLADPTTIAGNPKETLLAWCGEHCQGGYRVKEGGAVILELESDKEAFEAAHCGRKLGRPAGYVGPAEDGGNVLV